MLFGPGLWNWDLGIRKSFSVTKASQLQFRVDLFNAFNHVNLDFGREYPQQGGGATTVIADTRDGAQGRSSPPVPSLVLASYSWD